MVGRQKHAHSKTISAWAERLWGWDSNCKATKSQITRYCSNFSITG